METFHKLIFFDRVIDCLGTLLNILKALDILIFRTEKKYCKSLYEILTRIIHNENGKSIVLYNAQTPNR